MLRGRVGTTLKERGFEQVEHSFWRERRFGLDVIEFQESRHNRERFTINVGIGMPLAHELVWGSSVPMTGAHCQIRRRIGELLTADDGSWLDKWWDFNCEQQGDIEESIIDDINLAVFPFLESMKSFGDLSKELRKGSFSRQPATRLAMAAVASLVGDVSQAKVELEAMLKDSAMLGWHPRVIELADKIGVSVSASEESIES